MLNWLLVLVGGAAGAAARFGVNWLVGWYDRPAPWATFAVNLVGSFVLGLLAGWGGTQPGWVGPLLGTGFCGALTTWSTFAYETVRLAGTRPSGRGRALLNVTLTIGLGLGAAALGWLLGSTR